jgi:hypothetical protein
LEQLVDCTEVGSDQRRWCAAGRRKERSRDTDRAAVPAGRDTYSTPRKSGTRKVPTRLADRDRSDLGKNHGATWYLNQAARVPPAILCSHPGPAQVYREQRVATVAQTSSYQGVVQPISERAPGFGSAERPLPVHFARKEGFVAAFRGENAPRQASGLQLRGFESCLSEDRTGIEMWLDGASSAQITSRDRRQRFP